MKKVFISLCLIFYVFPSIFANEIEDFAIIKQAYEDKLYLFVEEKSNAFLNQSNYDNTSQRAQQVYLYLIGSLVERGIYVDALDKTEIFEKRFEKSNLSSSIQLYKAWSLLEHYVEEGRQLPEKYKFRPAEMIENVMDHLSKWENQMAYYLQGKDYFYRENYLKAMHSFRHLIDHHKKFEYYEDTMFFLGRAYYYLETPLYENALDIFNNLIEKNKRSPFIAHYHFWKGECLYVLGRLEGAKDTLEKALALANDEGILVDIFYNLGWLYSNLGKVSQAKRSFEKLFSEKLRPYASQYLESAKYKLASLFMLEKEYQKCVAECQALFDSENLKYEASLLAAQALIHLEKWDESVQLLEIAKESPVQAVQLEAKKNLGLVYYEQKNYQDALGTLKELISQQVPLDYRIDVKLQMAEVYFGSGQYYHAQTIYRNLLLEESKSLEAGLHYKLALCAMKTNPLLECFFEFEEINKEPNQKNIKKKLMKLSDRLSSVLVQFWTLSSNKQYSLNNDKVLEILSSNLNINIKEFGEEFVQKFVKENQKYPNELNVMSAKFNHLSSKFSEAFIKGKLPAFSKGKDAFKELAGYYPTLQTVEILTHLDKIIHMVEDSPFLALAHYEKAMLYKQQNLVSDAIESLQRAIKHTADPKRRTEYLFQMARTQFELAKNLNDFKGKSVKIKKALEIIKKVELFDYIPLEKTVYFKFSCYNLIQENNKAEKVLKDFLSYVEDIDVLKRTEEQLISFYFQMDRLLKAAEQKIHYANRIQENDIFLSQKLRFEAAEIFINLEDSSEEGKKLFIQLSEELPVSEWTFRASLKTLSIYQMMGDLEKSNQLIEKMNEPKDLSLEMQLEKEMSLGKHQLVLENNESAAAFFKSVLEKAPVKSLMKANALILYAKTIKKIDPKEAADAFLKFYYLFTNHKKREMALYESCRLKIKELNKQKHLDDFQQQKRELVVLVNKLEDKKSQNNLIDYLNKI